MAVQTFSWRVERNITPSINYRVIETQFGDGYKQVSADGINTKDEQYAIRVNARTNVAKQIIAFFDFHNGVKSFLWTNPLGNLGLYTCADATPTYMGGDLYVITGTFVKSYSSMGA